MNIIKVFRNFSLKNKIFQTSTRSLFIKNSSTLFKDYEYNTVRPYGTFGDQTGRFLRPTNDIAFKRIFGLEKNKSILIDFLNSILSSLNRSPIFDVQFLSNDLESDIFSKRQYRLDLLCRDSTGAHFILEIQIARQSNFEKRAQYYAADVYTRQFDRFGLYRDLREVVFIGITDFVLFPNSPDFQSVHTTRDRKTNQQILSDVSFIFLELPKYDKNINNVDSILNKWMYFFKYAHETNEEDVQRLFKGTLIEKAFEQLNIFHWSNGQLFAYDHQNLNVWCEEANLKAAQEEGRDQARKEIFQKIKQKIPFPETQD